MYKIKTMNKIAPAALEKMDAAEYMVKNDFENPDAILVRSAKLHDMTINPELLCIARAGVGVNNIPLDRCANEGVVVFNTPGANAEAVKELVICAMLLSARDVIGGIEWVKKIAHEGDDVPALVEKGKSSFTGPELKGKTLGVVGLGAIGAKIAQCATALGMKVYGYDPYLSVDSAWRLSSEIIHAKALDDIYNNSDYISLHIPYLDSTHHLINADALDKMKPGVRIINLARAELVSDDDIIAAIDRGKVRCYVTDFPNAKTADIPGIIAIPHLGASTPESEDNSADMACSEIVEYLENGNIINPVNMPPAYLARTGDKRICIIHKNVPEMLAKITAAVAKFPEENIENLINASTKGKEIAYTLIDLSPGNDAENILNAIKNLGSVIKVRIV